MGTQGTSDSHLWPTHHHGGVQVSLDFEGIDEFWCRLEDREDEGEREEPDPSLTAEQRSPSLMERR